MAWRHCGFGPSAGNALYMPPQAFQSINHVKYAVLGGEHRAMASSGGSMAPDVRSRPKTTAVYNRDPNKQHDQQVLALLDAWEHDSCRTTETLMKYWLRCYASHTIRSACNWACRDIPKPSTSRDPELSGAFVISMLILWSGNTQLRWDPCCVLLVSNEVVL